MASTNAFTGTLTLDAEAHKATLAFLNAMHKLGEYAGERAYLSCDGERIRLQLEYEHEARKSTLREVHKLDLFFDINSYDREHVQIWSLDPYGGHVALLATALRDLLLRVKATPVDGLNLHLRVNVCRYNTEQMFDPDRGVPGTYTVSAGNKAYSFEAYVPTQRSYGPVTPGWHRNEDSTVRSFLRGLDHVETMTERTVLA